jgi:perosamine synthetase
MKNYIPLYPPNIPRKSLDYLKKCVDENMVSTGGNLINIFESKISNITSSKYAVAFNSGTAALHIALKVIGVKESDEIIVPTLTFIATINSVIYNKCSPIFMDSDEDYNIDVRKVIHFLNKETIFKKKFSFNKKTKKRIFAIIVTHVWGNAANILKLKKICREKNIKIIEDASESLGTYYKKNQKHTGTLGDIGVLSFNANKIITTGGGGMLLTNKLKYSKLAKYYSLQAKDDPIFFVHNNVGYNYRMTNISAALGLHQSIELTKILKKKKKIRNLYLEYFKNKKKVSFFQGTDHSKNNNWMNIVRVNFDKKGSLKKIINLFEKKGVQVRPVWKLNHTQKPFKKFQAYQIKNAFRLVKKSLCLPSSINLSKKDILRITNLFDLRYE